MASPIAAELVLTDILKAQQAVKRLTVSVAKQKKNDTKKGERCPPFFVSFFFAILLRYSTNYQLH